MERVERSAQQAGPRAAADSASSSKANAMADFRPASVAQRALMGGAGATAQRAGPEEELQMKSDPVQRAGPEEELQMKADPAQLASDEEEKMQMKGDPAQLASEEEEKMQG